MLVYWQMFWHLAVRDLANLGNNHKIHVYCVEVYVKVTHSFFPKCHYPSSNMSHSHKRYKVLDSHYNLYMKRPQSTTYRWQLTLKERILLLWNFRDLCTTNVTTRHGCLKARTSSRSQPVRLNCTASYSREKHLNCSPPTVQFLMDSGWWDDWLHGRSIRLTKGLGQQKILFDSHPHFKDEITHIIAVHMNHALKFLWLKKQTKTLNVNEDK